MNFKWAGWRKQKKRKKGLFPYFLSVQLHIRKLIYHFQVRSAVQQVSTSHWLQELSFLRQVYLNDQGASITIHYHKYLIHMYSRLLNCNHYICRTFCASRKLWDMKGQPIACISLLCLYTAPAISLISHLHLMTLVVCIHDTYIGHQGELHCKGKI